MRSPGLNPRLDRSGISFERFAANPSAALLGSSPGTRSVWDAEHTGFRPLLPAQRFTAARIGAAWELRARVAASAAEKRAEAEQLTCRNGQYIEILHHHRELPAKARRDGV